MDARLDPAKSLVSSRGDAHVIRNAGGRDDFFADEPARRMGFFARRRMLREGLMSPEFIPPIGQSRMPQTTTGSSTGVDPEINL
jgi:hypothetical protein